MRRASAPQPAGLPLAPTPTPNTLPSMYLQGQLQLQLPRRARPPQLNHCPPACCWAHCCSAAARVTVARFTVANRHRVCNT